MMERKREITSPAHSARFIYYKSICPMRSFKASQSLWTVRIKVSAIQRPVKDPNKPSVNSEYKPKYCQVSAGCLIELAVSIMFDTVKVNCEIQNTQISGCFIFSPITYLQMLCIVNRAIKTWQNSKIVFVTLKNCISFSL